MLSTKMEQWLTALRSGEYKQTKGTLFDGEGYCCLGVADKVCFNVEFEYDGSDYVDDKDNAANLDPDRAAVLGLRRPVQDKEAAYINKHYGTRTEILANGITMRQDVLIQLNDSNHPFTEIADVIELFGWDREVKKDDSWQSATRSEVLSPQ